MNPKWGSIVPHRSRNGLPLTEGKSPIGVAPTYRFNGLRITFELTAAKSGSVVVIGRLFYVDTLRVELLKLLDNFEPTGRLGKCDFKKGLTGCPFARLRFDMSREMGAN